MNVVYQYKVNILFVINLQLFLTWTAEWEDFFTTTVHSQTKYEPPRGKTNNVVSEQV